MLVRPWGLNRTAWGQVSVLGYGVSYTRALLPCCLRLVSLIWSAQATVLYLERSLGNGEEAPSKANIDPYPTLAEAALRHATKPRSRNQQILTFSSPSAWSLYSHRGSHIQYPRPDLEDYLQLPKPTSNAKVGERSEILIPRAYIVKLCLCLS